MSTKKNIPGSLLLLVGLFLLAVQPVRAQERLCDPAFEDCRDPLWRLIDAETVGLDVAFWFMQDTSFATKIIARHNAGVPVRVLVDPRANPVYAGNEQVLNMLQSAGIPMRYNVTGGILHWKMMLFAGQNKVQFSGANYSAHFFVPSEPYRNYIDEAIYFTDDPNVVNSFKTQYDNIWVDIINYRNYANITGTLTRRYPTFPIDPELNFAPRGGGEEFANRCVFAYNREPQKIDVIMYRITDRRHTDGLIAAKNRGVTVRLLTEPQEYRNPAKFWHSWNVDRMYMAGIEVKQRNPQRLGLNHEKAVILYNQGLTIFGSSNWTTSSSNSQEEHNYFTRKTWFFNWFVNHFERKWNAPEENIPFVPLPPDAPSYRSPANGATAQPTTMTLKWEGGMYAHKYDVYFGTNPNPPLVATDHMVHIDSVYPGNDETYNLPPLQPGTRYYWRIVSKTMANMAANNGQTWSFTTAGTAPPPTTAPTVTSISPNAGSVNGGTAVTITGTGFAAGATVTIGGTAATAVTVVSDTSITATTPAHAAGSVDVVVTNTNALSGTLTNGFRYETAPPPQPPPTVTSISPNAGSVNGGTAVTITGTGFAAGATVTIGGTAATAVSVVNSTTINATTPAHAAGSVDVRVTNTNALSGTLTNGFRYEANPPPPPPSPSDIVLYASEATTKVGSWTVVSDSSAAGGSRMHQPDAGVAKIPAAVANPAHYFEMTFNAEAGRPYRLWIRAIAQNDFWGNDSVYVQFSGSVDESGTPVFRIGTASGEGVNLEDCSGCGLQGWGWQDNGWGIGVMGSLFYFATTGPQTLRVQAREDGISIDQIVLSPGTYLNTSPGALKNDAVILPRSDGNPPPPAPAPTVTGVSPNSGPATGGTAVTITGTGFAAGATVTIGGTAATAVSVVNSTTINATTPAHAAGSVNVTVTNADGQSGTRTGGFTYTAAPPPPNQPPQVSIVATPGSGNAPLSVSFTSTASDPDGTIASYNWNFGDGETSTQASPLHTYQSVGSFTAQLTVTDNQGATASTSTVITVSSGLPQNAPDVVLYAAEATVRAGGYVIVPDTSAAGGSRMHHPDASAPKLSAPRANPTHYFEMTFNAEAGRPYRLWIRGKAQNDYWGNDSIFVQFLGSVTSNGTPIYRIGTTSGADINLEDCSGCGLQGWGWQDNGWGVGVMGPLIYFQTTGLQTLRVQSREDGLSIDQIVLSPGTYLNSSPGALKNDTVVLSRP